MRPLILLVLATLSPALIAAEPPPLAIRALEQMSELDRDRWSYTKTTHTRDNVRVERHDATRPEGQRWTLVTIDDRKPTPEETREYQREKKKEDQNRNGRSDQKQEIDRDSIRLVAETPERATFSFRPKASGWGGEEIAGKIAGTLVVRKDDEWVERFEMVAGDEIRPAPGVKISEFRLVLKFQRDPRSGEVVPETIESRVRGRVLFVKALDDERISRFSEFEKSR